MTVTSLSVCYHNYQYYVIENCVWDTVWWLSNCFSEKASVLEMIRTVLANKENYYSHDVPADFVEHKAGELMGSVGDTGSVKDR